MDYNRLTSAPSRAQPDEFSDKFEALFSSISTTITDLNKKRATTDLLQPGIKKYQSTQDGSINYVNNPFSTNLNSYYTVIGDFNSVSINSNELNLDYVYAVIRFSSPNSFGFNSFEKYVSGYYIAIFVNFNSVNTATSFNINGQPWVMAMSAPNTRLRILPPITSSHYIITKPTYNRTERQNHGFVAPTTTTDEIYFFAKTRWKRVTLSTY